MENHVLSGREQILKDVINLAQNWKQEIDQAKFYGGTLQEINDFQKTPAAAKIQDALKKLKDYMLNLHFDDVKMLQTIMYLGRDQDYDKTLTANEIYDDYLKYIGRDGWNGKERDVQQMIEKVPLADYLKAGLKILDFTV